MQYRKDIDGLRAIAVALVIINHAGFSFFTGGFIGVDVFFVLSGYLITAIIYPRIQEETFEFGWFLSRRIRRLMPVLFVVMGVSTVVFTFILLPTDLVLFYKSLVSISLYLGNFFFWLEHGGYFAGTTQEVPLLHTWSLAVEEQYYFVWPIALILLSKIFNTTKTFIICILGLIFAAWFSQWATEVTVGAAYYLLPTRFFELLAGSCLAMMWHKCQINNQTTHHMLSVVGISLILFSAFTLNEHSQFPGYNALFPVIGTVLLIISNKGIINSLLSIKPIVYIGAISYSLYLWHWPILVFARYTAIEMTLLTKLICIILTVILSVFSYHFVEQKFRFSASHSFKATFTKMYFIPTCFFILIAFIGIFYNGFPERFSKEVVLQEAALHTFANETRKGCHSSLSQRDVMPSDSCTFAAELDTSQNNFFIFGDSHANHLVPFFETLAIESNTTGIDYTLDRCLPIFDLDWGSNSYKANECKLRNNQAQSYIKSKDFNFVVLAASWPGITTKRIFEKERITSPNKVREIFTKKLIETLTIIENSGATPIIAYDTPTLGGKSPNCTLKKSLYNPKLECSVKANDNALLKSVIVSIKDQFPSLIEIDIQQVICQDNICAMELNGVPLFRDEDHLNEIGAKAIANEYSKKLNNPFLTLKASSEDKY
ncbi:MAG: acyltransferase family protein [Cognaticolwellia sp.]